MDIQKIRELRQLDVVLLFGTEEILAAADVYAPKSCLVADEQGLALICPEGQEGKVGLQQLEYAEFGFERVEHARKNLWQLVKSRIAGKKRIGYNKYSCPVALLEESNFGAGKFFLGNVVVSNDAVCNSTTSNDSVCNTAVSNDAVCNIVNNISGYIDISEQIAESMLCKTPQFFEKYAAVKELNVMAYDRIRREIHSGCTEQELYTAVKETYVANSEGQVFYTGDFLAGKRTCKIAGPATDRKISKGDTIIVDALCACEGIYCDTTRTYFCGEPTKEQIRAYEILCALHEETRTLLRPGTVAGDIYRYVNRRLKEEGVGRLVHHAGHGLGYSWYEEPYFIEDCKTVLKEDMFVAIEPGIYLPGQFGMRLENNYRVTKNGGADVFCYKQRIEDFIIA